MPRLEGLIASVGSDCHFERITMLSDATFGGITYNSTDYHTTGVTKQVSSRVEAYLTHLTVERRLAANTVGSYGRDLALLLAFASKRQVRIEKLTRPHLEEFVRDSMAEGRSPRSIARAVGW